MVHEERDNPAHNQGEDLETGVLKNKEENEKETSDNNASKLKFESNSDTDTDNSSSVTTDDNPEVRCLSALKTFLF